MEAVLSAFCRKYNKSMDLLARALVWVPGVLVADVRFIEKPFATDEAAKSWLAGAEGQALKALLLSLACS